MKISLLILQYNNAQATINCLHSLVPQLIDGLEIVAIDNASEKDELQKLKDYVVQLANPSVKLLENGQNLGFAGGNNIGILQALKNGSDWVVIMNNDAWVDTGFTEALKADLEALTEDYKILEIPPQEAGKVAYAGKVKWLSSRLEHVYNLATLANTKNIYAIGTGLAIHKKVLEKTGLLDERYFIYFEDAEFSLRAKKLGFKIAIAPNCKIHHDQGSTSKNLGAPHLLYYHFRNAFLFNKTHGPWWVKLLLPIWVFWTIIKQFIKLIIGRNPEHSRAIIKAVQDFHKGRFGKLNA